jgi:two-component sensor histidine kinase
VKKFLLMTTMLASIAGPAFAQSGDGAIKIGILNDQSSSFSALGGPEVIDAVKLAIEDFGGQVLGKPIELVTADHQNKPDVGLSIAREWIETQNVDVIMDMANSAIALGVNTLLGEKKKLGLFVSPITDKPVEADCNGYVIAWAYDAYSVARSSAQAQLQALKMQIHPHLLFNTLNTISGCVYKDADLATRMIARLSELLRLTLETGAEAEISLDDELAITEKYLSIEQLRFADRLKVVMDIDVQAGDRQVPALILQPLVENAIRHGISPLIEGGTITIRARIEKAKLVIEVRNDGEGLRPPCQENGTGIGLKNIRSRLRQRYGEEASLDLNPVEPGGCRATLTLPLNFSGPCEGRP